jgi:type IV fimbrial biogenesis protein FimT
MFKSRSITPYPHSSERGFTLVELMVTLAIAAILMTMAVPSFSTMTKNSRLTTQTNQLVTALNLARSEAITRRTTINVVATDASSASNEWGEGWNVVVNGGATLRVFQPLEGGSTLDSTNSLNTLQYLATGRANATDTLTLCDDRTGETGRQITILTTGRITTNSNFACP